MNPDDDFCGLCFDNAREVRFKPCGHASTCELCTLKLIAHSMDMKLKCPTCTALIQHVAVFRCEEGTPDLAIFKRIPSAPTDLAVDAFIDLHTESEAPVLKAAAAKAKDAWKRGRPSLMRDDAALRLPVPNSLAGRVLAVLGSFALVTVWLWALVVANEASVQLEELLETQQFDVKVTALDGIPGPVNALLPVNQTCGGAPCADVLPDPDDHQRWWGLVPAEEVGAVSDTGGVEKGRWFVGVLMVFSGTITQLKTLLSAVYNQPRALSELANAGFNSMLHIVLLFSLCAACCPASTTYLHRLPPPPPPPLASTAASAAGLHRHHRRLLRLDLTGTPCSGTRSTA